MAGRGRAVKVCVVILAVVLTGALAWGLAPFVDRSAPASHPVPMHNAPMSGASALSAAIDGQLPGIEAFVIHEGGKVVFSHGPVDVPMNLASARKSVLSLLFGIAWDRKLVDLDATLADLGIDETATPLTGAERRATLENLLQARSGVYLPSGAETPEMKKARPQRGQFAPGAHFYYNNWDFNVLGTIFEARTGKRIGDALDQWLARPLGMEDFNSSHVYFDPASGDTNYATWRMFMSARDLARLGTLILQDGQWEGRRVVSSAWLARSLAPHSTFAPNKCCFETDGYGYSWWLASADQAVIADGWGGQYLYVDRANQLVFVSRRDTGNSRFGFLWFRQFGTSGEPKDLLAVRGQVLAQRALRP
jgi:CubicO group peptidase (beta-lactamase class C family)